MYKTAEDAAGLNETTIADTNGICPPITGAQDTLFRGALFAGPGTAGVEGPYWSTGQTITAGSGTNVTLATDFLVASNRLKLKSVTNATFTPGAVVSQTGGKSATICGYDSVTAMLYTGPITAGPFANNVAVTAVGGGAATADGDSVPWVIAGGEPYFILQPTFNGTPTSNVLIQEIRNDAGSAAITVVLAGQMPKHYGTKQYRETRRVSGQGIATTQDFSTAWLDIGVPVLTALADNDWKIKVSAEPGGGERVVDVYIRDSLNASATMWGTGSDDYYAANQFPAGWEPTTLGTTITEDGILYRHAACGTAVHLPNTKDWAVFGPDPADVDRRPMFAYIAQIGGAWTPIPVRKAVPYVTPVISGTDFNRWEFRSNEQALDGEPGGCGMQYIRGMDSQGDYITAPFDITYPMESDDFGDNVRSDDCIGLNMSQTCNGSVVDGNFIHSMYGAAYNNQKESYRQEEGIYRKDRAANRWTRTKALLDVCGSNQGMLRTHLKYIAMVPGSGSGPATRTLYAIHAPCRYDPAGIAAGDFTTFQLMKSTNGGTSWPNDGGAVNTSGTGVPFVLAVKHNGSGVAQILYIATHTKVIWRTAGGTTWNTAAGISGNIRALEVHGNTVWALSKGNGLYKATDTGSGPGTFTLFKGFNAQHFAVAPSNNNYITIIPDKNITPTQPKAIFTKNGLAGTPTWNDVNSIAYPGQPNGFNSELKGDGCIAMYHSTDESRVFYMLFQHCGKSVNGGATVNWAARTFGYSRVHAVAFHPTDPYRMLGCMTDRIAVAFEHGMGFGIDDELVKADIDDIDAVIGNQSAHAGSGALILARGAHTGRVAIVGGGGAGVNKVPVIFSRGTSTTTSGTGNSTLAIAASPALPGGEYILACTVAGGAGTGKFSVTGPLALNMGEVTVGTERVITHPRGGTLTVTVSGGTTNVTGQNAKTFVYDVHPLMNDNILVGATPLSKSFFGETNPATTHLGISGRHRFSMDTAGVVTRIGSTSHEFQGYMGPTGNIVLGSSSDTALVRSIDGGVSATAWYSSSNNFSPMGGARVAWGSHHDGQRAYVGSVDGRVRKIQDGSAKVIFSFADWVVLNGVVDATHPATWPGTGVVVTSGGFSVPMPAVIGVAESWFDPNLVYCALHLYGAPYQFFRTKNALAGTPVWENMTDALGIGAPASGFKGNCYMGPVYSLFIHRHTDECILASQHGSLFFRPEAAHRALYNLPSLVDHIRTLPGGNYYETARP